MPHYLVELYSPKPAWLALSQAERQAFFAAIEEGMSALLSAGIEPLALGQVDGNLPHAASQNFYAVWRCSDEKGIDALVNGISGSGWHAYFDTVNAAGAADDLAAHLHQLAQL